MRAWAVQGDITATGNWSGTIDSGDLTGGPGTDLNPTYTSGSSQVSITISNTGDDWDFWRVDVRKSDTNWHGDLQISVRRTSSGTGGGAISGGTSYQAAGDVDAQFFTGRGDRSDVNVKLQLSGVSVQVPPDTYATSVVFTVVDT
jgi:hypothetical protein